MSRVDGPLKVKGAARFAAEFALEDMVYAAVAFSTIAKGRIASIDITAAVARARRRAGHDASQRAEDEADAAVHDRFESGGGDSLPVMQDDRIHWNGQPIAVVLAETQEQADHAKSLIHATYEAEAATTSFEAAKAQGTEPGMFQGEELKVKWATPRRPWRSPRTGST